MDGLSPRPGSSSQLAGPSFWPLHSATLPPKLDGRPPDPVCLDELVLHGAFTQSAAETFLRVYDNTIAYAGLSNSDTLKDEGKRDKVPPPAKPKVGDLVQWESQGQLQFAEPRRVRAVTEDGDASWVFVEGSETGIPALEITVQQAIPEIGVVTPPLAPPRLPEAPSERERMRGPLSKESSYRLLVQGDLGPREISKLIKLLEAQRLVLSDDEEEAN